MQKLDEGEDFADLAESPVPDRTNGVYLLKLREVKELSRLMVGEDEADLEPSS